MNNEYWDAADLGDDTGRAYASVLEDEREDGRVTVSVTFNEELRWHIENHPRPALESWLEQKDLDLLAEVIEDELQNSTRVTAWPAQGAENPEEDAIEFSIEIALAPSFSDEDLSAAAWPFIATCINVCDPGTFGAPYIMNALPRED